MPVNSMPDRIRRVIPSPDRSMESVIMPFLWLEPVSHRIVRVNALRPPDPDKGWWAAVVQMPFHDIRSEAKTSCGSLWSLKVHTPGVSYP
ncbi:hypothetical protein HCU01_35310 [Halomonas cupida]|uniref:Uncharacterized protein n=1 Tax=Halomonas cupida TaxID=44933 RepID=A0ABQ0WKZ3_9GAMM|nr:hypothetical protein HCU01_35310 [Halomonas cupida]